MKQKLNKVEQVETIIAALLEKPKFSKLSKTDTQFISQADTGQITYALADLLVQGVTIDRIWRMWKNHKDSLPNVPEKMRSRLAPNHVICKIMAEHQLAMCYTFDLEEVNHEIQRMEEGGSLNTEIRRLARIAGWLASCKQHREREEEIILPELERRGHLWLGEMLRPQYEQLVDRLGKLGQLVWKVDGMAFPAFKRELSKLVDYIVPTMQRHVFLEEYVMLPLAIEDIPESKVWEKIKAFCDHIGYSWTETV